MNFKTLRNCLVAAVLGLLSSGASARAETFATEFASLAFSNNAEIKSLIQTGTTTDWLLKGPQPFASIKKGGKVFPATSIQPDGALWKVDFGNSGVQAFFRITPHRHYLVFELHQVVGNGVEELTLVQLKVACREKVGEWLGVARNESFAVNLLGLSSSIHIQAIGNGTVTASVYPEFGMEGQKVALVAAPTHELLDIIQEVETDFELPSPKINGIWAKRSQDVRTSYLFTDLTEANASETIGYAKLGGFKYIMIQSDTWASSLGTYGINKKNFPGGETSLKATVDRCHAAGLKVGLHMLTSLVDKVDPLVRPIPDPRLLKDARTTLASPVDDDTLLITASEALTNFPPDTAFTIQIDEEIIRYSAIGGPQTNQFLKCVRGYAGTRAARHQKGAVIEHLAERYGSYLADLRSSLKDEIADKIAGIINRCGFDMVYFDGGEASAANGPYWYWVGQQQDAICRRVKRDLLVQGSGITHWSWHWFARGCCDDFAAVAPKQYLDCHKIQDYWALYTRNLMPAELGWWGFLAAQPDHPATTPDEVEFYATRMLALDTPVSLESSLASLRKNGRTKESLRLLGEFEQLRLSNTVPPAVRMKLRTGEWHLFRQSNHWAFVPIKYESRRIRIPSEVDLTGVTETAPFAFRLQAVPSICPPGDPGSITLFADQQSAPLKLPDSDSVMPGALAKRIELGRGQNASSAKPLNLLSHRALAITLRVDSPKTPNSQVAVINVQLESNSRTYRDHFVDLNFTGERTIVVPEPNSERTLPEFRPAIENYPFKSAMYNFAYERISALNLRWMRLPKNEAISCQVLRIEALGENETASTRVLLTTPDIELPLVDKIRTGEYVECSTKGLCRSFDSNGFILQGQDSLSGHNADKAIAGRVFLRADKPAEVKITIAQSAGEPISW